MSEYAEPRELDGEDRELVDLVEAVLVDPNVHTDLRMHLAQEITELLRTAHEHAYGPRGVEVHERALEAHGGHVPGVLAEVLVDPNLHTDVRMRVHREISEILRGTCSYAGH
jgi:ribosome maturation protein Sdo1